MTTLSDRLDTLTRPAELVQPLDDQAVRCLACAHRCLVKPDRQGICKVRFNRGGTLFAPWGYVAALQLGPIEKKPFSHVLPGSSALTFGMLGCDFHCDFCQNWLTSQACATRPPDSISTKSSKYPPSSWYPTPCATAPRWWFPPTTSR